MLKARPSASNSCCRAWSPKAGSCCSSAVACHGRESQPMLASICAAELEITCHAVHACCALTCCCCLQASAVDSGLGPRRWEGVLCGVPCWKMLTSEEYCCRMPASGELQAAVTSVLLDNLQGQAAAQLGFFLQTCRNEGWSAAAAVSDPAMLCPSAAARALASPTCTAFCRRTLPSRSMGTLAHMMICSAVG